MRDHLIHFYNVHSLTPLTEPTSSSHLLTAFNHLLLLKDGFNFLISLTPVIGLALLRFRYINLQIRYNATLSAVCSSVPQGLMLMIFLKKETRSCYCQSVKCNYLGR